ncbi:MAG: M23 family metallopeptidase [Clostridia bacterium]|nr:M23 family metallopeptidase [Clostridia bacterium]
MKKNRYPGLIAVILLIAVLFVPTYIALISYRKTAKTPPDVSAAETLEISDRNGVTYRFDDENDAGASGIRKIFSNMTKKAELIDALPDPLRDERYFRVTFLLDEPKTYKFFFSLTSDSYIEDSAAKAYRLAREEVTPFLATPYANSLYSAAKLPSLYQDEEKKTEILPETVEWHYRAGSGQFFTLPDGSAAVASDKQHVVSDGSFLFPYSELPGNPDSAYAKVYGADGSLLYDGKFDDLSGKLNVDKNASFTLALTASWFEVSSRDYYGTLTYSVIVDVNAPARFSLAQTSAIRGGVAVLTAENAADPAKITFTSSPALTYEGKEITPTFYSDGTTSRALIVMDPALPSASYEFTLTYGAVTQTLSFTTDTSRYNAYRSGYESDSKNAATTHSPEALAALTDLLASLAKNSAKTPLWSGTFKEINAISYAMGFGHTCRITATGETYENRAVEYNIAKGSDVPAAADGVVAYVGYLDYPGKFVVIDHGLGLMTVYLHMSEYTVEVGARVKAGDVIGKTGDSGYVMKAGVSHASLYAVGGCAICPYDLQEKGLPVD